MNEIIYYCERCGFRVPPQDLESGAAKPLEDNRALCCRCLPPSQRTSPAQGKPKLRESGLVVRPSLSKVAPAAPSQTASAAAAARSTGQSSRLTHSAAEAHATPSSNKLLYVGAGLLVILLVVAVFVSATSGPLNPHAKGSGTGTNRERNGPPDATTTAPPVGPTEADGDRGAKALEKAHAFAREHPGDLESYFYELLGVMRTYKGSASAAQAEKIQASLTFPPGELPPPIEWYEGWSITPDADKPVSHFEVDGQYAVLETRPASPAQARVLKRRLKVDADRPILDFAVKGEAGKACEVTVRCAGRNLLSLPVSSAAWRRVAVDCSAWKGEEFEIALTHRPGTFGTEPVYWSPPRWKTRASTDAAVAVFPAIVRKPAPPVPGEAAWSKALDLLPLAKPEEDGVNGRFKLDGGAVLSESCPYARLALPYRPPEEYDLKVTFSRLRGTSAVALLLARGGTGFGLQFAAANNRLCGLERVEGLGADANVTTVENVIENNRSYTVLVQVRGDGVWVHLDGQLLTRHATDYTDMDADPLWSLGSKTGQLGLASSDSEVSFRSVQVLEVTGKGTVLRDASGARLVKDEAPQVVNLLALAKLAEDVVSGDWSVRGSELVVRESKPRSRLVLPYLPPEEYDYRVSFTMPAKLGQICLIFSQGERALGFVAISSDPKAPRCGYEMLDGNSISNNPTLVQGKPVLSAGQRYALITQVRKGRVRTLLNGAELLSFQTDLANASLHPDWSPGEKGKGRLCLAVMGCEAIFHDVSVAEVSGRGRIERVPGTPAVSSAENSRQVWAVFLDEVSRSLQRDDLAAARKRVDEALADKDLAALKEEVKKDAQLINLLSDIEQAALDGLALVKGGRAFTFERNREKEPLKVGQGSLNKVLKVNGEQCEVEQDVGGGKVIVSMSLKDLTGTTRLALAQLALTEKPGDQIKLLAFEIARLAPGAPAEDVAVLNKRLDAAAKDEAQARLAERLRRWLDQKDHEARFELAFAQVVAVTAKFEYEPAKAALEDLKKSFSDTAALAASGKRIAELEQGVKSLELKTGLWAMFYHKKGNNPMAELKLSEEITKLAEDYKDQAPRNGVNKDNFSVRVCGILLIAKKGKYEFQVRGDDIITLFIDGKKICEDPNKGPSTGAVELSAGLHNISVSYQENTGVAYWNVQWRKPGAAQFSPIPSSVLRYDPLKKGEYEKL